MRLRGGYRFYVEQLKETLLWRSNEDDERDSWIFDKETRLAEDSEITAFGGALPCDEADAKTLSAFRLGRI